MYEIMQVIINLALIALGVYLFVKKTETENADGETIVKHKYRVIGIVIIVLVILGALSPHMPKG